MLYKGSRWIKTRGRLSFRCWLLLKIYYRMYHIWWACLWKSILTETYICSVVFNFIYSTSSIKSLLHPSEIIIRLIHDEWNEYMTIVFDRFRRTITAFIMLGKNWLLICPVAFWISTRNCREQEIYCTWFIRINIFMSSLNSNYVCVCDD